LWKSNLKQTQKKAERKIAAVHINDLFSKSGLCESGFSFLPKNKQTNKNQQNSSGPENGAFDKCIDQNA
jgi:hypothetical protein